MVDSYITRTNNNDKHFIKMVQALKKHLFPLTSLDYYDSSKMSYAETKKQFLYPAKILFVYLHNSVEMFIGKGMYTEIQQFLEKGNDEIYLITASNFVEGRYEILKIENISFGVPNNSNWIKHVEIDFFVNAQTHFEFNDFTIISGLNFIDYIKSKNKTHFNELLIKCL